MPSILALDQGTSSSRAVLVDHAGTITHTGQRELPQLYPQPGWVEQDPEAIWSSQLAAVRSLMEQSRIAHDDILAIGLTNQRETTIVWDRKSGQPIYNALVWQDRRGAALCAELQTAGHEPLFQQKTGLLLDAYFSASKIRWLLDHVPGARDRASRGELAFGTVDTWLIWKLTAGRHHVIDVTNASRSLVFDIRTLAWDDELLDLWQIPRSMMPTPVASSMNMDADCPRVGPHLRDILPDVPICGIAGDQQAALFGQMCFSPGLVKNTYGTGCFMLMQTGTEPTPSKNRLLTTIAVKIGERTTYALEGSIFVGGAAVQWLRDGLGIISSSAEVEPLAASVPDADGVVFVPALSGLGAPHWDPHARGTILGLTRGSTRAHIARATLEAIALQVTEILTAMQHDSGITIPELRVDGGASENALLMQMQADLLGCPVVRGATPESTALGAALLAGLAVGFWADLAELEAMRKARATFTPAIDAQARTQRLTRWQQAIERSRNWAPSDS